MKFADVQSGGKFFKPEEQKDAAAFLIEVLRFQPQAPSKFGPKDAIHANISVFATEADVDAGKPTAEFKNSEIQQTVLVKNLSGLVGQATVAALVQLPPQNGNRPAWAWQAVSEGLKEKVIAYAIKREQEIEKALESVPDFE